MDLLEECVEVLKPSVKVIPRKQGQSYSRLITDNFPININGRIHWSKVSKKVLLYDDQDVQKYFEKLLGTLDEKILIFWAEASLPLLEANLLDVLQNLDDVLAVDFDTWIISPKHRFVIEFYHEGDITIGFF